MAWQAPKTNWDGTSGVTSNDLNRIEENIRVLSQSSGLFVEATKVAGANNYNCSFAVAPTVVKGFSFNIAFNANNSEAYLPTYLTINGSSYELTLQNAGNYQSRLPRSYISTLTIYNVIYTGAYFILRQDSNTLDTRTSGYTLDINPWASGSYYPNIMDGINNLKKFALNSRTISVKGPSVGSTTYAENLNITGFHGGDVEISFAQGVALQGNIFIADCTARIIIRGYVNDQEGSAVFGAITIMDCAHVEISYLNFSGTGVNSSGPIQAYLTNSLWLNYLRINNCPKVLTISEVGAVYSQNVSGTGNTAGYTLTSTTLYNRNYTNNATVHTRTAAQIIV